MLFLLLFSILSSLFNGINAAVEYTNLVRVSDHSEFKKLIRVHSNVLVLFSDGYENSASTRSLLPILSEAATLAFGKATIALVDCQSIEGKKLCKKLKITPKPFILRHFHQGSVNRDFDRQLKSRSIYRFLLDPVGDLPWDEDPSGTAIVHLADKKALQKLLRSTRLPVLVMMYTPWCGYCKRLKPEFGAAAVAVKDKAILAAIDLNEPENAEVQTIYEVDGFPTLIYFDQDGKYKFRYGGENTKDGIINWLNNPVEKKSTESTESETANWSDDPETAIVHLTDETFDEFISEHESVLVMFHAPWCGHCKRAKPEYESAARRLKQKENFQGVLAAVDATLQKKIAQTYKVEGYPTFKYFKQGQFAWDVHERVEDRFYDFMINPIEPPPPEIPWSDRGGAVTHLNAENWGSLRRKKHSLVMFYAPWCAHCKKAMPEFDTLADRLLEESSVSVAAVDCAREESLCQQHSITAFPTIVYFNYLKSPLPYSGAHKTEALLTFLKQQMKVSDSGIKTEF